MKFKKRVVFALIFCGLANLAVAKDRKDYQFRMEVTSKADPNIRNVYFFEWADIWVRNTDKSKWEKVFLSPTHAVVAAGLDKPKEVGVMKIHDIFYLSDKNPSIDILPFSPGSSFKIQIFDQKKDSVVLSTQ